MIRPGAIGDVFCLLTLQQAIREKYGGFDLYCDKSIIKILGNTIWEYGLVDVLDESNRFSWAGLGADELLNVITPAYVNTPIQLTAYPINEGYPFKVPMQKHLKQYMEKEIGVESKYPLFLQSKPRGHLTEDKFITIQTKAGWSRYKEWSLEQWEELIKIIKNNTTLKIHQIGAADDPTPKGIDQKVKGFGDCLHNQCYAEAHVGIDSIFNHTSDVMWGHKAEKTPAVILFGSTCPTGFGYEGNQNISLDLSCQPCYKENVEIVNAANRSPCFNNHKCMREISPEMVWEKLKEMIGL